MVLKNKAERRGLDFSMQSQYLLEGLKKREGRMVHFRDKTGTCYLSDLNLVPTTQDQVSVP
jgi:hypothetical protein